MPTCGIYYIENKVNGKVYIGSSRQAEYRMSHHFKLLRRGQHFNPHLQASFDLYGEENFSRKIMSSCPQELLLKLEQLYIDANTGNYYNMCSVAKNTTGRPCSEETRKKISEGNKGKLAGDKNRLYGKHLPDDTKRKISETSKKRDISYLKNPECIKKRSIKLSETLKRKYANGYKNNFQDKKHSEYTKNKMAEAWKHRTTTRVKVLECDLNNKIIKEHRSIKEAIDFYNISLYMFNKIINGEGRTKTGNILKKDYTLT